MDEFVFCSHLAIASRVFSGFTWFPPPTKTNISNLTRIEEVHGNQLQLMWLDLSKYCNLCHICPHLDKAGA